MKTKEETKRQNLFTTFLTAIQSVISIVIVSIIVIRIIPPKRVWFFTSI